MTTADSQPSVGIDLGTTFSVVSILDSSGRPTTVPNAEGDLTTPSAVFFDDDAILVGKEALKAGRGDPSRLVQFAKRDMGNPAYSRAINGEHYPPEVIQSLILEKLRRDAEQRIGPFTKCVITVPAYFNDPRRKATQDAGQLAGLEVIDIINEPTAAAIAFGVQQGFVGKDGSTAKKETILIYDLGGGTFDVTLMSIEGHSYTALATAGDVHLGGIDWDNRLVNRIAAEFKSKYGVDVLANPTARNRLLNEAEDLKRTLSAKESASLSFECGQHCLRMKITRSEFEQLTRDLLDRTRFTTLQVLREAGVTWAEVTRLLLVGGSTRMPMVSAMLEQESGKKPDRTLSEDEAVGHGAAIYAGLLLAKKDETAEPQFAVKNVNSHSLGVLGIEAQTNRRRNAVMIPKNTPLPVTSKRTFKTRDANQRSVVVNVIEGGDASGNDSTPVGRCVLKDLPAGLDAGITVEVMFTYGTDGRLTVDASLPSIGKKHTVEIDRPIGLTKQQLGEWDRRIREELRPSTTDNRINSSKQEKLNPNHGNQQPPPLPKPNPSVSPPAITPDSKGAALAKQALAFGAGAVTGAILNSLGFDKKQSKAISTKAAGFVTRKLTVADSDGDGVTDAVGMDISGDGRIDAVGIDSNKDGKLDTVGIDTNQDGRIDVVGKDLDGDGIVDVVAADTNYDGNFDRVAADTDGDGEADIAAADLDDDGDIDAVAYEEEEEEGNDWDFT